MNITYIIGYIVGTICLAFAEHYKEIGSVRWFIVFLIGLLGITLTDLLINKEDK